MEEVERIGGTFDGAAHSDRVYIFTLLVDVTCPVVEAIFNRFVSLHPAAEWFFGNVPEDTNAPSGRRCR